MRYSGLIKRELLIRLIYSERLIKGNVHAGPRGHVVSFGSIKRRRSGLSRCHEQELIRAWDTTLQVNAIVRYLLSIESDCQAVRFQSIQRSAPFEYRKVALTIVCQMETTPYLVRSLIGRQTIDGGRENALGTKQKEQKQLSYYATCRTKSCINEKFLRGSEN